MGSIRRTVTSSPQGLYDSSATQLAPLGTVLNLGDGREFVYGSAGAVAIEVGRMCQSSIAVSGHATTGRALDAPLIGTRVVNLTVATTLVTENQYAEGYLCIVNATTGGATTGAAVGTTYKIAGHPAAASTGTFAITLVDPLWVTMDATAMGNLIAHPCDGALIMASAPTRGLVGVAVRDIAATEFGWFQRKGIAACLQDGTWVAGNPLVISDGVDGALAPMTGTDSAVDETIVGQCYEITASGDFGTALLNI